MCLVLVFVLFHDTAAGSWPLSDELPLAAALPTWFYAEIQKFSWWPARALFRSRNSCSAAGSGGAEQGAEPGATAGQCDAGTRPASNLIDKLFARVGEAGRWMKFCVSSSARFYFLEKR